MSSFIRVHILFLIISLVSIPGFSQKADPKKNTGTPVKEPPATIESNEESSRTDGLRKIASRSPHRYFDFDINIDEEALESDIESAVENAMESVEVALEALEIHIAPIEFNLGELDLDIDPIEIHIPDLDIDIDIDEADFNWDDDQQDEKFRDEVTLPSDQPNNQKDEKDNSKKDDKEK